VNVGGKFLGPEGAQLRLRGRSCCRWSVRNPEPRRRSVFWISAPCYGEAGVTRSAFTRRFIWRGYRATHPSIARLLWVGSHRSPLLHPTSVGCLCRCLSTFHRLISTTWIAGSAGPMGAAMCVACRDAKRSVESGTEIGLCLGAISAPGRTLAGSDAAGFQGCLRYPSKRLPPGEDISPRRCQTTLTFG
jgi:hypothetical protein